MAKLYVICGHGAGDPGACANGYEEAERVRVLGKKIKELGGSSVTLGDINRNFYADEGIMNLNVSKDTQIIELHMDSASASARGAHVIISSKYDPDKYDTALAKFISGVFPGRSEIIKKRSDLANVNRAAYKGYPYRLMECGFISNAEDVKIFNGNIDKIAKGILECFGIKASNSTSSSEKPAEKPSGSTSKYIVNDLVKEFQKAINKDYGWSLAVDGSCGPDMQSKLALMHICPYPASDFDDRPNTMKIVQRKLGGLDVDGMNGPKTSAKVKSFQKAQKLKDVNGVVGKDTIMAICKVYG